MRIRLGALLLVGAVALSSRGAWATGFDWAPFQQQDVIHLLTHDEDGDLRDTKVWVVVVDDSGFVRTNASRWLENIERNPEVQIRVRGYDYLMRAEEVKDAALKERIEEAFREKYGLLQRVMSWVRLREPTVLRLLPRSNAAPGAR